jgi:hypothetical protein
MRSLLHALIEDKQHPAVAGRYGAAARSVPGSRVAEEMTAAALPDLCCSVLCAACCWQPSGGCYLISSCGASAFVKGGVADTQGIGGFVHAFQSYIVLRMIS